MALWRRLLAGSDWAYLSDVLSPAFFDVVSPRQLSVRAAELARHWFDHAGAKQLAEQLNRAALDAGMPVRLSVELDGRSRIPFVGRSPTLTHSEPARDGCALIEFFFFQIYASDAVFLDLRANRFYSGQGGQVVFMPLPLWTRWQPEFVSGIRLLYRGFYGGSDPEYEQALSQLGISAAKDVFSRAFGGSRKRANQYSVAGFEETFHDVFVRCRDAKTALHPDFLTLGISLVTLHDHLETLGGTYDTEACLLRVLKLLEDRP